MINNFHLKYILYNLSTPRIPMFLNFVLDYSVRSMNLAIAHNSLILLTLILFSRHLYKIQLENKTQHSKTIDIYTKNKRAMLLKSIILIRNEYMLAK